MDSHRVAQNTKFYFFFFSFKYIFLILFSWKVAFTISQSSYMYVCDMYVMNVWHVGYTTYVIVTFYINTPDKTESHPAEFSLIQCDTAISFDKRLDESRNGVYKGLQVWFLEVSLFNGMIPPVGASHSWVNHVKPPNCGDTDVGDWIAIPNNSTRFSKGMSKIF